MLRTRARRATILATAFAAVVAACGQATGGATTAPTVAAPTTEPGTMAPTADPMTAAPATPAPVAIPGVQLANMTGVGEFLVDAEGMSLYLFKNDEGGTSSCTGDCATAWPPFVIEAGEFVATGEGVTGTFATIERDDGSLQVTYEGVPLYYFSGDAAAGDVAGQGVNSVWFLVDADGEAITAETGGRGTY